MIDDITRFHQVNSRIATGGKITGDQVRELYMAGWKVIISMAPDSKYDDLVDEGSIAASLSMEYVFIPIVWEEPLLEDFERFARVMNHYSDKQVFVHCNANRRASIFVALWQILYQGLSQEEAISHVKAVWEPNEIWTTFIEQVLTVNHS